MKLLPATLQNQVRLLLSNQRVRSLTLFVIAALVHSTMVVAQDPVVVPDFTKEAKRPENSRHDWNLGPTGLRGWIFCDRLVTTDARQILITQVDKGSPAADTLQVGDVILGVGGKPFSFDPRTEFGRAITIAETKAGNGKLVLTRWRAGKSDEVMINLRVLGSYSQTAPFDCDKSKLLLDQGCKQLAARMAQPNYTDMDPKLTDARVKMCLVGCSVKRRLRSSPRGSAFSNLFVLSQ